MKNNEELNSEIETLDMPETKEVKAEKPEKEKRKDKKQHKEIERLEEEKRNLNDKLLRISAEMQNMRKRYEDEIARIYKYSGEEVITHLLSVIDNFERAIKLDDSNLSDELSKFLEGFKMIYGNLLNILESLEVKEIECLRKEFDPNTMEAVMTSHEEGIEPNIVIDVMQKGYMFKDKVIRVAMVKVSE